MSGDQLLATQSIIDELKAALAQNKILKAKIAKLERENAELKRDIDLIYDAQNG